MSEMESAPIDPLKLKAYLAGSRKPSLLDHKFEMGKCRWCATTLKEFFDTPVECLPTK